MENKLLNRYKSVNDIVNVLFVIGYIIDFCFRRSVIDLSFKFISFIPFVVNIVLISYLVYIIYKVRDENNKLVKETVGTIFKFIFNLIFILMIIYI